MKEKVFEYHKKKFPGKVEIVSKEITNEKDLELAYSPGVAEVVTEILKDRTKSLEYTAKGNLVGVITNGSAVLGLGNVGPDAAKPVMEGKVALLKTLANVNAFDIEVDTQNQEEFIDFVKKIAPTFGAINLEDIKAPECFEIEEKLQGIGIPVVHDDQHGTAIAVTAAALNAIKKINKRPQEIKWVVKGAGAAGIATIKLMLSFGFQKNLMGVFDSKGCIHEKRNDINQYKREIATKRAFANLDEALENADLFIGLSKGNTLKTIQNMSERPIVFALANPEPEISFQEAKKQKTNVIFACGKSGFKNQINNAIVFPHIFRALLDNKVNCLNLNIKKACVQGIIDLDLQEDLIIPNLFDPRLKKAISSKIKSAL